MSNEGKIVNLTRKVRGTDWRELITNSDLVQDPDSNSNLSDVHQDVKLRVPENFSLTVHNNAGTPLAQFINKLSSGVVAGGVLASSGLIGGLSAETGSPVGETLQNAATFNPWFKNLKAWESTDPLKTNLTFKFRIGQYRLWSAVEEVVKPILALIQTVLPETQGDLFMTGPFQSVVQLYAGLINGLAGITSGGDELAEVTKQLSRTMEDQAAEKTWKVSIGGYVVFESAYIINASVSFSNETDNIGWPISGSITLDIEGYKPPFQHKAKKIDGEDGVSQSYRFLGAKF